MQKNGLHLSSGLRHGWMNYMRSNYMRSNYMSSNYMSCNSSNCNSSNRINNH